MGVTTRELNRTLWPGKDDDSARNNRNVYLNRLRSILRQIPEISIVKEHQCWCVKWPEAVFCDYTRAAALIDTLQTSPQLDINLFTELVELGLRGTLLPHIQKSEWIEPWQSDFGTGMIECLKRWAGDDRVASDARLQLKIADAIQLQDCIDEDAIELKCRALVKMGHKAKALQAFNRFTHDYEQILAESHQLVYKDLVR
jgi:DNA-binding SARP family transcriptional activator